MDTEKISDFTKIAAGNSRLYGKINGEKFAGQLLMQRVKEEIRLQARNRRKL